MTDTITGLVYVGDPMCSWCWGFATEIEALSREMDVDVVVGGLRPGPMSRELDDAMAKSLANHWRQVEEHTGQVFDQRFLDRRDGWVYDTEPAAIAVTQMREMRETETLPYFVDIQRAFYVRGEDVTDFETLAALAESHGFDPEEFAAVIRTDVARKTAWEDFSKSRNWGIAGFPAVIGKLDDGRLALLARGWTSADTIRDRIASLAEAAV